MTFNPTHTSGNNTLQLSFGNSSNNVIRVGGSGNISVNAAITGSNPLAITATGTGSVLFSAANTYTGATTVNNGRLAVNGSLASAVTVSSGATLGGNGTLNGLVTLNSGANLTPGDGVGTLTLGGGLTLNASSTVTMEINGDSTFDTISVTGGNLAYGGNLNLVFGYIPAVSSNFTLFTGGSVASSTGNLTLNFASNPGFDGTFDPSNGKLTLTAVPEPKTLLLFALGASFLLWRARGRRAGS